MDYGYPMNMNEADLYASLLFLSVAKVDLGGGEWFSFPHKHA